MASVGTDQASRFAAPERGTSHFSLLTSCISFIFFALYLLSMPVYCLIRLSGQTMLIGLSTAFTAISLFAFSLTHCIKTRGAPRSIVMLMSAFAIALTMEYLGSAHGFLFGNYDYTDRFGLRVLGEVPIIIPIAWFMMLYPAWSVATLLSETLNVKRNLSRFTFHSSSSSGQAVLRIMLAALAMTAWDLSLDPRMTADGNWIWHDGGAYFGIPVSNYIGWFVTAALIYVVWTPIQMENAELSIEKEFSQCSILNSQFLPVWVYVITWLGESMANALFWGGPAVAACVFVGMGLFGASALWLMLGQRKV